MGASCGRLGGCLGVFGRPLGGLWGCFWELLGSFGCWGGCFAGLLVGWRDFLLVLSCFRKPKEGFLETKINCKRGEDQDKKSDEAGNEFLHDFEVVFGMKI